MNAPSTQGRRTVIGARIGADDLARNATTRRNQQIAMWGLGGVLVMAGMWWIIASPTPDGQRREEGRSQGDQDLDR
jgi:conjugal transfer pilus assembly protein TraB